MTTKQNIRNRFKDKWKPTKKTRKPQRKQWKQEWRAKNNTWILLKTKEKSINKSKKNQWEPQKTNEKKRRNIEKQWKTKGNFASIPSYFWTFCLCCFEFFIFNGQRNQKFLKEAGNLSWGVLATECSQGRVNMQWNAIFVAYVVQTGSFFSLLFLGVPLWRKTRCTERT